MNISRTQLKRLLKSLKLPRKGIEYVLNEYDKNTPSRKGNGKHFSVFEQIASRKMGWTQSSDARSTELPFLLACEFLKDVYLVFSQPSEIKIQYINKNDKKVTCLVRLDFLVITQTKILLVECKRQEWLERSSIEEPTKFTKVGTSYKYLPAEATAKDLGIEVLVSTDKDFTPEFTRNCIFLLNFIDDLGEHDLEVSEHIREAIAASGNRLKLFELNQAYGQLNVLKAIFHQCVYINFDSELLIEPDLVWVYADRCYRDAIAQLTQENQLIPATCPSQLLNINTIWWETAPIEVLHAATHPSYALKLRRNNGTIISLDEHNIRRLIHDQELLIKVSAAGQSSIHNELCTKKAYQIEEATKALAMINGHARPTVSERTLYRMKAKAKDAIDPLLALLSNKDKRGNTKPRLSEPVLALIEKYLQTLLQPSPPPVYHIWAAFKEECEAIGHSSCSYEAFNKRFKKIDKFRRTLKQKGFKAAYSLGPTPREIDLDWDLPYHGDYIFEVVHIDHTPLEITLKSAITGEPLKETLQLSVMYDGHSRVILAVHISFEKPSYRATMMLLRECYRRYKRLPIFIAVDHGTDFQSYYFDATLADLGIHKRNRPTSASRHGTVIERNFGTTETELVHHLKGNRQLNKLGRGLSTTHQPSKYADITPDEFDIRLKEYAYVTSAHTNRRGISETPQNRWDRNLLKFDDLPGTKVKSEAQFYLATLNDVDRGGTRCLNRNQLEFKGSNYLLSQKVPGYGGERLNVEVRYDPYNIAHIWVCIKDRWLKMTTNDVLVRECFDRGVKLAHLEVFSRRTRNSKRKRSSLGRAAAIQASAQTNETHAFNMSQADIGKALVPTEKQPKTLEDFMIDLSKISSLATTENEEVDYE